MPKANISSEHSSHIDRRQANIDRRGGVLPPVLLIRKTKPYSGGETPPLHFALPASFLNFAFHISIHLRIKTAPNIKTNHPEILLKDGLFTITNTNIDLQIYF